MKPDAGAATIVYNTTCLENTRHGIIATGLDVCNANRHLGDGSRRILSQKERGSARAVRAVQNTPVFHTETRVVADVVPDASRYLMTKSNCGVEQY